MINTVKSNLLRSIFRSTTVVNEMLFPDLGLQPLASHEGYKTLQQEVFYIKPALPDQDPPRFVFVR